MITIRFHSMVWFVTGAVLAATLMLVFANAWRVDAAPGDSDTTFVPLAAPCRLTDTRPPPARVGTTAAFGVADTKTLQATGTNGECTIPPDAVSLSLNVTALNATTQSFLTFWPGGTRPLASSLNPAPGQPPVPNAVTVTLSASGSFSIYNDAGSVNVIVDINGYSTKTSLQQLTNRLDDLETTTQALDTAQPFTVASAPISARTGDNRVRSIMQVTVTAPVDGQVATLASGSMEILAFDGVVECGLMDNIAEPPPQFRVSHETASTVQTHLSTSRVFDIDAGATATYHLICRVTTDDSFRVDAPQVTAIFTPAP